MSHTAGVFLQYTHTSYSLKHTNIQTHMRRSWPPRPYNVLFICSQQHSCFWEWCMINSPCSSLLYVQNSGTHRSSQQNWLPPTTSIKRGPWTVHTNHSLNLSLTVAQYHSPPHGRATCRRDITRGNPLIVTPKGSLFLFLRIWTFSSCPVPNRNRLSDTT